MIVLDFLKEDQIKFHISPLNPSTRSSLTMGRADVKQLLSNERTFLEWSGMAVTLGGFATGLIAFSSSNDSESEAAHTIGAFLMPSALSFAVYAAYLFMWRRDKIVSTEKANLQAVKGPAVLTAILLASLVLVFVTDVFTGGTM